MLKVCPSKDQSEISNPTHITPYFGGNKEKSNKLMVRRNQEDQLSILRTQEDMVDKSSLSGEDAVVLHETINTINRKTSAFQTFCIEKRPRKKRDTEIQEKRKVRLPPLKSNRQQRNPSLSQKVPDSKETKLSNASFVILVNKRSSKNHCEKTSVEILKIKPGQVQKESLNVLLRRKTQEDITQECSSSSRVCTDNSSRLLNSKILDEGERYNFKNKNRKRGMSINHGNTKSQKHIRDLSAEKAISQLKIMLGQNDLL